MTFNDLFKKWGLKNIKLNIGFAEMEFSPTQDDMIAAWDMYVELLTRITTQPLEEGTGDEDTALTSIYSVFPITREILKNKGREAKEFTKIAIIVLNQIIRPFTAKWHKKKIEGAFADSTECKKFRGELIVLQNELKCYSRLLADMAKVEDLTEISE
jgi:hypothetical protein